MLSTLGGIRMKSLAYTVPTAKSIDEAIAAIQENAPAHGFCVLHIHDIAADLAHIWPARADRYSAQRASRTGPTSPPRDKVEMSYIGG